MQVHAERLSASSILLTIAALLLAACGGGGAGNGADPAPTPASTPAPTPAIAAPTGLSYPSPQNYPVGAAITPLSPNVTGTVTAYSVAPSLPSGLSIDAVTGQISGTPAIVATSAVTITALNSSGSTTFQLTINVQPPPPPSALSYPGPVAATIGQPITPLNPTVIGTVSAFTVSPALPSGLQLNSTTGQISGTPAVVAAAANYTITAANAQGSTSFTLSLTVRLAPPSNLSYRSPVVYPLGEAITPLDPSVTGTVTNYAVSPALPAGLALNPVSGKITGTPAAATATANYVITASNAGGSTNFTLSLQVSLLAPRALSYAGPVRLAVGVAMTPLDPSVVGVVSSYLVSPALPAALALNGSTGRISGTPSLLAAAADYVITATNASGSTTYTLSITIAAAAVSPARISRLVAVGTPVTIALAVSSATLPSGATIYSTASTPSNVFATAVSATTVSGGHVLYLTVSTSAPAGRYTGNVTLNLCSDVPCSVPLAPASIVVPYDLRVLSSGDAWSGNNLTPLAARQPAPDWTMYQGNAAHTGLVPVSIDPNRFSTRWQGPTLNNKFPPSYDLSTTLATSGGRIFIAANNSLFAFSENDASQIWVRNLGLTVSPPAVADGTVYIMSTLSDLQLRAFNASDGGSLFARFLAVPWGQQNPGATIGPQGVYAYGASDSTGNPNQGGLYGFGFSGLPTFFRYLGYGSNSTPAVDAAHVYFHFGSLLVVNPATGVVDATIPNNGLQDCETSVLGAPDSVFARCRSGFNVHDRLVRFNVASRSVAWQSNGDFPTNPAYGAGVAYAPNNNPLRLEARDEGTGNLLWSWIPPLPGDAGFVSEVMLTNTMAFVSTNLNVYGIDLVTHRTVWSYPFPGSLALSQNGILYIQGVGPLTAINVW
jgi:hypothetical protein